MPGKDPSFWQGLANYIPHGLVALATFVMAFLRAIHEGGRWQKSLLGALMCTLLAGSLYPVFLWIAETREWPSVVAFPPCVFLAALGTDWLREKADDAYEIFIGRWRK